MSVQSGAIDLVPGRVLSPGEVVDISKLNDLANPTLRVAAGSITPRELDATVREGISTPAADSLEEYMLKDGAVTTTKMGNLAVTNDKLATQSVSESKMAPGLSVDIRDAWLFVS